MVQTFGSVALQQQQVGDTTWIAVRARGAEWSWLTQDDAVRLARMLMASCGQEAETEAARSIH